MSFHVACLFAGHAWQGCVCTRCGKVRDADHLWQGCVCARCGKERHRWKDGVCEVCGASCPHEHWDAVHEENYGAMDYDSAGRGVADYIVTLYRCRACGELKKEARGDFCGDDSEYTAITAEEYRTYGR